MAWFVMLGVAFVLWWWWLWNNSKCVLVPLVLTIINGVLSIIDPPNFLPNFVMASGVTLLAVIVISLKLLPCCVRWRAARWERARAPLLPLVAPMRVPRPVSYTSESTGT